MQNSIQKECGYITSYPPTLSRLYIITCLFKLHAEYVMRNSGLEEAQAGIKSEGEISVTTLMAESEKELKSLLMKVRGE